MSEPKYPRISVRIDKATAKAIKEANPPRGEVAREVQSHLRRRYGLSDKSRQDVR